MTVDNLTKGAHTFAAKVTDNAGNVSALTTSPTVTDYVQPTGVTNVTQTGGDWNQSASDTITVTTNSANTVSSVDIYDNGTKLAGTATSAGANTWTYNATGLADGTHAFSAVATDNLGNASLPASSIIVTDKVDLTAPVISKIAQSEPSAGTTSATDAITVTVGDGSNGSAVASVQVYDGTTSLGGATDNHDGTWTYTAGTVQSPLSEGAPSPQPSPGRTRLGEFAA